MKRQDLKRGMRCTERSGLQYIIDEVEADKITFIYPVGDDYSGVYYINEDLTSGTIYDDADIMKVEDITEDGYEVIWEREEERYYLKLPKGYHYNTYLNYSYQRNRYYFSDKEESKDFKTTFTLVEIKNLPNQKFIQSLEREKVE